MGYRLLFANSPLPMWMFDPRSLQFVAVNEAAIARYGYSREEFGHMHLSDILPPQANPAQPSPTQRHRWKDGRWREVEVASQSLTVGGRALTLAVIHDVTERNQTESELAYERNLLRTVIDIVPDFIYAKDSASRFILVNRASAGSFGRAPEEVVGKTDFELHPPELAAQFLTDEQAILRSGESLVDREEMMYENGQERWQLTTTVPLRDSAGHVTGLVGISRNITERRRAEAALLASEARYRHIFDTAGVSIWEEDFSQLKATLDALRAQGVTDLHAYLLAHPQFVRQAAQLVRVLDVNAATLRMLGLASKAELLGGLGQQVVTDENLAMLRAEIEALAAGKTYFEAEGVSRTQQGERRDVLITMTFPTDPQQLSSVMVTLTDITENKRRERELETVAAVSTAVRTAQNLDELLASWLDHTLAAFNATGGSIWLHDPQTHELRPAVLRGWSQPPGAVPVGAIRSSTGIPGHVFTTRQVYLTPDFARDPHLAESLRDRMPPGGVAGIPIPVGDEVIGAFIVNTPLGQALRPGEIDLLSTLAEIAGSGIQRTRFLAQMEQRLSQLDSLRAIDQAITASLDLNLTLTVFLDQVVTQLHVDAADVLLLEPSEQMLSYAAGRGFRTREFQQSRMRVGEGRAGRAVLERQIVVSELSDTRLSSKRTTQLGGEGFVSYVGVPLIAKGQVLGALEIFNRQPLEQSAEWMSFLTALAGQAALALDNAALFSGLQRSNTDLQLAYDATIEGWSRALDLRDKETEGHSQRVTRLTEQLAAILDLPDDQMEHLRWGALLHDIGKMGVPDHILLKPGPLTDDEWVIMRRHPTLAYEMLVPIHYLRQSLVIPYCHHEKWDGTGYPRGIKGAAIPLPARIFAVVDVWDALSSDRPYRPAWPASQVREYLRAQSGHHFDPAMVEPFLRLRHPRSQIGPKAPHPL